MNDSAFLFLILLPLYMLPFLVAMGRGHKNTAPIFLLNLFLGWTFLGWIAALIWSASDNTKQEAQQ